MQTINGRCHCGNISYTFEWPQAGPGIPVRACSCTFCVKHGGVYTSHPGARLEVRVADPQRVNRYSFGTRTADFHVCTGCGVVPFVTSTIDGHEYAVVNVNTFEDPDVLDLQSSTTNFDGESVEERLRRRQRNWIPHVSISAPA